MKTLGTIVFVGTDPCARTAVLASVGYTLRQCECDADALRETLLQGPAGAVLFQMQLWRLEQSADSLREGKTNIALRGRKTF